MGLVDLRSMLTAVEMLVHLLVHYHDNKVNG